MPKQHKNKRKREAKVKKFQLDFRFQLKCSIYQFKRKQKPNNSLKRIFLSLWSLLIKIL